VSCARKVPVNGQKSRMEFSVSSYLHIDLLFEGFFVRFHRVVVEGKFKGG
jgi:hypothetical protein